MRMLGVQTSQLEKAAKGTIALKSLGLEEAAAHKAVAMALQGNYDMLNRYVPALRSATSEEEKARIVNDLFEKGYDQQKDMLDTVAGQWGALKGRVGDLWEEMGRAIVQSDGVKDALGRAGDAVKNFTGKVSEWIDGGGMIRLIGGVKQFYQEARRYFRLTGNSVAVVWGSLTDGAATAFLYVGNLVGAWVENLTSRFKFVGKVIKAAWDTVTKGKKFETPDFSEIDKADKKLLDAVKGKDAAITTATEKALADREKIEKDYADSSSKIQEEMLKHHEALRKRQAEAAKAAAEAEKKAAEDTGKVTEVVTEEQKKAAIDALKEKLKGIQDEKKDERKADKQELADKAKDDEKAARMEDRIARGARIKGERMEWLEAHRSIKAAESKLKKGGDLAKAESSIKDQIKAAQDSLGIEKKMAASLNNINQTLDEAINY